MNADGVKFGASVSLDEQAERIRYLRPMMSVHVASLSLAFFGLLLMPLWIAAAALALVVMVLMTTAAWIEAGRAYALRHLLLYVVMTPLGLLGPILVPFMVWSDLTKCRAASMNDAGASC